MNGRKTPESSGDEAGGSPFETGDEASASADQPQPPPAPFEPESRRKLGGRGCVWMVGVGCGLVLLAGLALVAAMAFNGDRILAWSLAQFETQILADVPDSVTEDEQEELREAFTTARESIRAGDVDPQALQSFQSLMMEMAFKPPGERDADDYQRLQEALERLAEGPEAEDVRPSDGSDDGRNVAGILGHRLGVLTDCAVGDDAGVWTRDLCHSVTVVTAVTPLTS